jgi:hypothetical protein
MPIGAPTTYPILEDVMVLARSLVNDTWSGATNTPGEGQILVDNSSLAPFTIPFINSGIRKVYRALDISGVATLIQDNIILSNLGPVNGPLGLAAPDPSIQVSVTYAGYNDGSGTINAAIQLPANTLSVLKLWERQHGSNNPFVEMNQSQFGLASRFQVTTLNDWEYRQDAIYMVGSILATDIRLRTTVALAGAVSGAGNDFASLSIPILDCTDAVAWSIVELYSARLEPDFLETAKEHSDEEIAKLVLRQVRQKQSVPYHRQGYGDDGDSGKAPLIITGQS